MDPLAFEEQSEDAGGDGCGGGRAAVLVGAAVLEVCRELLHQATYCTESTLFLFCFFLIKYVRVQFFCLRTRCWS